jgi:hypothetical protein
MSKSRIKVPPFQCELAPHFGGSRSTAVPSAARMESAIYLNRQQIVTCSP